MARILRQLSIAAITIVSVHAAQAATPMSDEQLDGVTAGAAVIVKTRANGGGGKFGLGVTNTTAIAGGGGAAGSGFAIAAGVGTNTNAQTSGQSSGQGTRTAGNTVTSSIGGNGAPFALSLTLTSGFALGR